MRDSDSLSRPAGFTEGVADPIVLKKGRVCPVRPRLVPIIDTTTGAGSFLNFLARQAVE
jgi:hypothetical protein